MARGFEAELARLAALVMGGLEVNPIPETQLVELSYRSTSPELAARIANAYADVFIKWGLDTRTEKVGQAETFLSEEIAELQREIGESQQKLNAYTSSSDFALDPAGEALVERRQTLERQYNSVVLERVGKLSALQELRQLAPETVANSNSGGRVSQLKSELVALQNEYDSKLATYRPEWPDMVKLKERIDEKSAEIDRVVREISQEAINRASADYQQARREEASLEAELAQLADEARQQNSVALEYTNQSTAINTRKELLADLLKRQSETEVQSRLQTTEGSNVRVVDAAVIPKHHFRPALERNLPTALLFGLLLGVGTILALEFMDRTIKTPDELESLLGVPTLTVIPDLEEGRSAGRRFRYGKQSYGYGYGYGYNTEPVAGGKGARGKKGGEAPVDIELLPHHNPRLAVCEVYRSLRTALLLSSTGGLEVVGLTSAEPGEGKTATTCNLGVVMAQLGRKVLIIDADLRRPRMHKVFKQPNRLGLVNYLTGQPNLDELFIATEVPNLYICPSGPIPPNPSELLSSDRMREFLRQVRARFDFVLIDTPPTLPVADAVILGPLTDGMVVCARAHVVQREDAKMCRDRLKYGDFRILGAVLNRYREGAAGYGKRYRYYGVYEDRSAAAKTHSAA